MKKIAFLFVSFALFSGAVVAQKTIDDATAEKRNVGSFHGISVGTGIQLTLTAGASEEVAVSAATTEFRDKIVTTVENGILKIMYESSKGSVNKKKETKDLRAYVSYKMLDQLDASTGARVKFNGVLNAGSLSMKASTGAIIDGEVAVSSLSLDQNTGSKVNLSGKTDKLTVEGSTGSKFEGEDMATTDCRIEVSTGAKATVRAEKELQVKASTGGNVRYKGDASIREIKTSTGGSVSKI